MCPCTQNPNLSAHEGLEGMFSFDTTPMTPIGNECMIHIKPACRQTWGYCAIKAWYFAPALNHYRCINAVTDTGAVHLTDTFNFLHHTLPTTTISNADCITKAIKNLENTISALMHMVITSANSHQASGDTNGARPHSVWLLTISSSNWLASHMQNISKKH
ncbi:hypothetical protein ACHAW6_004113 [Cyclotella cf. meneghiniana]